MCFLTDRHNKNKRVFDGVFFSVKIKINLIFFSNVSQIQFCIDEKCLIDFYSCFKLKKKNRRTSLPFSKEGIGLTENFPGM